MSTAAVPVRSEIIHKINPMQIRPFAHQPREYFDTEELNALEMSIVQHGQLQAGLVKEIDGDPDHEYELVDGQRRWHACMKLRLPFRASVIKPGSVEEQFEISVASNFQRAEHTPMEISRAIDRICTQNGKTETYVATLMGKSAFWINAHRRLVHLAPEIQELVEPKTPDAERLPIGLATQLARMPHNEQRAMLELIRKKGLSTVAALDRIKTKLSDAGVISPRTLLPADHSKSIQTFLYGTTTKIEILLERLTPEASAGIAALLQERRRAEKVQLTIRMLVEQLQELSGRLAIEDSQGAPVRQPQAPRSTPEPAPASHTTYIYSHPMKCPKCTNGGVRFRKQRDADPATGNWVCMAKGCNIRISHVVMKIDRNYRG